MPVTDFESALSGSQPVHFDQALPALPRDEIIQPPILYQPVELAARRMTNGLGCIRNR